MSNYEEPSDTRAKQLIQDRQERLEDALDIFTQQAAQASVPPSMKREIAIHIVNFHRVLSNYRDESVLDDGDIPDISPIRSRLGQTTTVTADAPGLGRGQTRREVPAVDDLDPWYLEAVAGELEAAAKTLGFWAAAKEGGDHDDVSEDDLKALLQARGQDEAVANLPSEQEADG